MENFINQSPFSPFYWTYFAVIYGYNKSTKEGSPMKTATMKRYTSTSRIPRYPNAADRRYYLHRLLDGILGIATAVGAFVTLIFFLLL